jgi:hypothetical protein
MFNFSCLASRDQVMWADMGPPTDYRGPLGAASGPLFPSQMKLQYSNWVGPILSSGFPVAARICEIENSQGEIPPSQGGCSCARWAETNNPGHSEIFSFKVSCFEMGTRFENYFLEVEREKIKLILTRICEIENSRYALQLHFKQCPFPNQIQFGLENRF